MAQAFLADLVVLLHLAFVLFVAFGALLLLRWRRAAWLHLPALVWGVLIELTGRVCPLTPLENRLRRAAGASGYEGDFVEHYVLPIVYPPGLTRPSQLLLAGALVLANVALYAWVCSRTRARRRGDGSG